MLLKNEGRVLPLASTSVRVSNVVGLAPLNASPCPPAAPTVSVPAPLTVLPLPIPFQLQTMSVAVTFPVPPSVPAVTVSVGVLALVVSGTVLRADESAVRDGARGVVVAATGSGNTHPALLRAAVDAHEKAIVEHHLGRNRYNQRQTAKALGLSYDQLRHCMKKHGLGERG